MKNLTLYMEPDVIKAAKRIAKQNKMSVSKIVSEFFRVAVKTRDIKSLYGLPPVVMSMIGILKDDGKTYKEIRNEYYQHQLDKYNRISKETK